MTDNLINEYKHQSYSGTLPLPDKKTQHLLKKDQEYWRKRMAKDLKTDVFK